MLKLVTELEGQSNLFNKILALPEPQDPVIWSLQDPSYGDLDLTIAAHTQKWGATLSNII